MHLTSRAQVIAALTLTTALAAVGCGGEQYKIGQVSGVLMLRGKPGNNVMLQFVPDADSGVVGPPAAARTDDQGRFVLHIKERGKEPVEGAVVGNHRVTLRDMAFSKSETGRGVPVRFSTKYGSVASTPLRQEVKEGEQDIELTVP